MTALVETDRLVGSLDWELTPSEVADAADTLEYLSDLARTHAGQVWEYLCPPIVRGTILAAAKRYMRNADGYTQSRAGDETLAWDGQGDKAGTPYFTSQEIAVIRACVGRVGFGSVTVNAWGTSNNRVVSGYVPTGPDSKPFPLYGGDGPW